MISIRPIGILIANAFLISVLSTVSHGQNRTRLNAPPALLEILDPEDRQCVVTNGGLRKSVSIQPIQLASNRSRQILVKGSGSCLCGAQNCYFWIYRIAGSDYELILTGAGSTKVRAGQQSVKGYRDVVSESHASANETIIRTYRYDGSRYRLQNCVNRAYYNDKGEFTKRPNFRPCDEEKQVQRESRLPSGILDRKLTTIDNRQFKLSDFSDRTIVLNLFASGCDACRENLQELVELNRSYVAHRIEVIGLVSSKNEKDPAHVRQFVGDINFAVIWDTNDLGAALVKATHGQSVIPQTFVIDSSGTVRKFFPGYNPSQTPRLLRETLDQIDQKPAKSP